MALHKLPHESMASSSWLSLGPIGTGALGLLLLGGDAPAIFAANGLPGIGEVANGLGLVAGVILWGLGLWWLLMALLITARYLRSGIPFNLGWWGFTFPIGVYASTSFKLAERLHLTFFSALGTLLVLGLALLWCVVLSRTVRGAYKGELFVSPCIAGLGR
jgi:tellurite resistance protein TehA-like permease